MVLVVFLFAWLVRRRLDLSGTLSGDQVWRVWFHSGRSAEAGREVEIRWGLVRVIGPALLLAGLVWTASVYGWRMSLYPLEFLLLLVLMGAPGWKPLLRAYSEAWSRGICRQPGIISRIACPLTSGGRRFRRMKCIWRCPEN
ncbi:hypothetical protein [Marinobacter sp. NP-4(2019)]|uniref:hypothetical protein n=1 Tax=Marinobacter sp. NP-4(2019) TaxID=2488665 RepID=UPI001D1880F4|nr:hypothetical protein [Marinobacter sp. NP-4(2019)]